MAKINKGNPTIDAMSETELARFFEEHKDDPTLWEKKPRKIRSRRGQGASTVFAIRLSPQELEELFAAATARDVSLTEFIRTTALDEARSVKA